MGGSVSKHPEACARARSTIDEVVSGEASPQVVSELESHVSACLDCSAELELARTIEGGLGAMAELEPPASIWTKLEARLDEAERGPQARKSTAEQPALKLVRLPARS